MIPPVRIYFSDEDIEEIKEGVERILRSGRLTLGEYTKKFEEEFARYCGVKYAVAVNSGTAALEIILRALKVEGKKVIVPVNTFYATAGAVVHAGGIPVFCDIDEDTFSIGVEQVVKVMDKDVVGVIIVHIGGIITPEINELKEFCDANGLFLVEDAAHAHGSKYLGDSAGSFGIAGAFSFYPTKVITSGEGGMIVTNDEWIYREALVYRDQGKESFGRNLHTRLGYNWRMSEVEALIGLVQLRRLGLFIAGRKRVAMKYEEEFFKQGVKGARPLIVPTERVCSSWYKYIVMLDDWIDRDELKRRMKEKGVVLAGEVYEVPLHRQPIFEKYVDKVCGYPVADRVCSKHICLPIFYGMDDVLISEVVKRLKETIEEMREVK